MDGPGVKGKRGREGVCNSLLHQSVPCSSSYPVEIGPRTTAGRAKCRDEGKKAVMVVVMNCAAVSLA